MSTAAHLDAPKINPADHLGLVGQIAGKYGRSQQADFEDITQEGYLGLIAASKRFDPSWGIKFSTLAFPYIAGTISNHRNSSVGPFKVCTDAARIEAKADREGTPTEALPARVKAVRKLRGMTRFEIDVRESDVSPDPAVYVEDDGPAAIDDADEVRHLIGKANLYPVERACLLAFYGLDGKPPRTPAEIAQERGVCLSNPGMAVRRALAKLRKAAGVEGGGA